MKLRGPASASPVRQPKSRRSEERDLRYQSLPGANLLSGTVDLPSFPKRRKEDQGRIVPVIAHVTFSHYDNILRDAGPVQAKIDRLGSSPSVDPIWHHHQQVHVTVRSHLSPRR